MKVGLFPLLFCIFLTLKLCGVIAWSWWWVTLPLWWWIPVAGVVCVVCIIGAITVAWMERK